MTWQPGRRVITEEDHQLWAEWRLQAKREGQRARRRRLRRIDYECSTEMREFLTSLQRRHGWVPISALLDSIVRAWAPLYIEGQAPLDL